MLQVLCIMLSFISGLSYIDTEKFEPQALVAIKTCVVYGIKLTILIKIQNYLSFGLCIEK